MIDRIRTPSPNRPRTLEKGAFSSLSTFSLSKQPERKQPSLISKVKSSTPIKSSRQPPLKKADNEDELHRQQETIRKLSSQLAKERKHNHLLESQLKQFRANELKPLAMSIERANKTIEALRTTQRTLAQDKENLTVTLTKAQNQVTSLDTHLKAFAELLVDLVESIVQPLLEYQPETKEEILTNIQQACLKECINTSRDTDFGSYIERVKAWAKPTELNNLTKDVSFAADTATALFDFQGERTGDLVFEAGDVIEILEKHESGWWVGRRGSQIGPFPFNFVQLM